MRCGHPSKAADCQMMHRNRMTPRYILESDLQLKQQFCQYLLSLPATFAIHTCQLHLPATFARRIRHTHFPVAFASQTSDLPTTFANSTCQPHLLTRRQTYRQYHPHLQAAGLAHWTCKSHLPGKFASLYLTGQTRA